MAEALDYDPRAVSVCDDLRTAIRHGSRVVRPNILITWWTHDNRAYSAVATGPSGRSVVKTTGHMVKAQEAALAAYIRGNLATYDEEREWSTR